MIFVVLIVNFISYLSELMLFPNKYLTDVEKLLSFCWFMNDSRDTIWRITY